MWSSLFFLMLRRPPRSTPRHTLALHDALPIYRREGIAAAQQAAVGLLLLDKYRGRAADLAVEEAGKRPLAGRPPAGGTRLAQSHGELRHPGRRRTLASRIAKDVNVGAAAVQIGRASWRDRLCQYV